MMEFVNGKDDIPYMEKKHVPNHQADGNITEVSLHDLPFAIFLDDCCQCHELRPHLSFTSYPQDSI